MRAMTLRDLLTMRSGLDWAESGRLYLPGTGNDVLTMIETGDWTRFVLDRAMATAPGTRFNYDTGAAHLVSAAISALAGRPADELAAEALFAPLGITDVLWKRAPEGVSVGGFGLCSSRATSPRSPSSPSTGAAGTAARSSPPSGWRRRPPTRSGARRTSTATSGGWTAPTATPTWPASTASSPPSSPARGLVVGDHRPHAGRGRLERGEPVAARGVRLPAAW